MRSLGDYGLTRGHNMESGNGRISLASLRFISEQNATLKRDPKDYKTFYGSSNSPSYLELPNFSLSICRETSHSRSSIFIQREYT